MNKKIKWGILGTADIAKTAIIPAIKASGNSEIIAVASRSLDKAKSFARQFNIPKAYGNYQRLLNDVEVDAVYNPLPVSLHAEWSIKSAEAGKPTLCEKPMALNAAQVERMIGIFSEKKLLLAEALMYRYHPLTIKFLELVESGAIGKLKTMQSHFTVNIANPKDIRLQKATGGGALLDLGVYCVSILRHIAQEEPSQVKSVAKLNDENVDTSFSGIMNFPSGVLGSFNCSLTAQFSCGYSVFGSRGTMVVDRGGMVPWPGEKFKIKLWQMGQYEEIVIPAANHYRLMIEDFAHSLLHGTPLRFSLQDTLQNSKVMDGLLRDIDAGLPN